MTNRGFQRWMPLVAVCGLLSQACGGEDGAGSGSGAASGSGASAGSAGSGGGASGGTTATGGSAGSAASGGGGASGSGGSDPDAGGQGGTAGQDAGTTGGAGGQDASVGGSGGASGSGGTGGGVGGSGGASGSGGTGGGTAVCTGTGFAQGPTAFALPTGYAKGYFNDLNGDSNCDSYNGYARPTYRFVDIDGDAKADMVVTYACGSSALAGADPNVGKTKWKVHKNIGTGFAQTATDFALPTGYAKGYFNDLDGSSNCDSYNGYARPSYHFTDINGDARPDMVVTYACGSSTLAGADPDVGKTKWKVHLNSGSGFAQTAIDWPLPTGYAKGYFNDLDGSSNCDSYNGYARPSYRFTDINGDARPDMVVTYACGSSALAGADPDVGKTKWWVHANTGSGFAAHTDFALPAGYAKGYFNDLEGDSNCDSYNGYARPTYRFVDLNADSKPDMVVTYACGSSALAGADPNVGKTKWWLHANTGSGFAAHTDWNLPTGYAKGYFNDLTGSSNCDSYNGYARPTYRLADLDGNGKLDMVVTYACGSSALAGADPNAGKSYWLVHASTGAGFAASASTWCLPGGYAKGYFNDLEGSSNCDSYNGYARPTYRTTDLIGGGRMEMAVTYACGSSTLSGADPDVGKTKWYWH